MRPVNQKRARGNRSGGRRPHPNNANRSYDSNGPEVKIRGSANHIFERYCQLARDASASGDRIAAENHLQHAEHYYRIMLASGLVTPRQPNQRGSGQGNSGNGGPNGSGTYDDDEDDDQSSSYGEQPGNQQSGNQQSGSPQLDLEQPRPPQDSQQGDDNTDDRGERSERVEAGSGAEQAESGRGDQPRREPRAPRRRRNSRAEQAAPATPPAGQEDGATESDADSGGEAEEAAA